MSNTRTHDRETTASRLLRGSSRASYDPMVDIDWDQELDPTAPAVPLERVSLHGTPLWDALSEAERVKLSWHEFASTASVGLWFEMCLMQALLRYAYDRYPGTADVQYCLTEVGDETRHSVMFARAAERLAPGCHYGPSARVHQLGRLWKTVAAGPAMFASVLVAEEYLDRIQRETIATPGLLPLAVDVARIHVTEEARHVSYARAALERSSPRLSRTTRALHQQLTAVTSAFVVDALIDPRVYAAVGLDPVEAARVARNNPAHRRTRQWASERVVAFLRDCDMHEDTLGFWRRADLRPVRGSSRLSA